MKTYDQILEEIAQTESRIKRLRKRIKEEAETEESIFLQNYGFTLRNEAIKLETLNWVINK
jgi:cell division septum initiation protein DivIVA